MNDNPPPADHPAVQSAIYHLTLALIPSGSLKPAELTAPLAALLTRAS
jgi:hypothetical protein